MSHSSLAYDSCSYEEKLRRSVGPGMYQIATPANDCDACARDVPADPYMRYQAWGPGACPVGAAVDDGSELRGLNYKNSKCSTDAYLPGKYAAKGACTPAGAANGGCAAPTEPTRLSNPPCTLRGTGWNRWEWLCWNPQERAIRPFEWFTAGRMMMKDNHVPCLETPMDEGAFVPNGSAGRAAGGAVGRDMMPAAAWAAPNGCGAEAPGNPFAPSLKSCGDVRKM
jgi:hypothetical protein